MKEAKNNNNKFFKFFSKTKTVEDTENVLPEAIVPPIPAAEPQAEFVPAGETIQNEGHTAEETADFEHIWDPTDDPLTVMVDEAQLASDRRGFEKKMQSFSAILKRGAAAQPEPQPKGAMAQLCVSKDMMAAWFYVISPLNEGPDITVEELIKALEKERVTIGINAETLGLIVNNKIYDQVILIAKGELAHNGVEGSIVDYFQRSVQLEFEEDDRGNVNFRQLNNIQGIREGDVICDIIAGIPGQDGRTVTGRPYPCKIKGKNAVIPSGHNTVLSSDQTQLLSQKTGHVTFRGGKFYVDSLLKIDGDVNNSTGNLDYEGDILITGDVRNGFSVKATGNIQIKGSVEGATIMGGGSVTIANGMSGNGHGDITATGDVKCRYLEHCNVTSEGSIFAESIINSKVESGRDVVVTSGMGVIIGGTILAAQNITTNIIGSKARRLMTELVLDSLPHNFTEANKLNKELEQLTHNLVELDKNITYLHSATSSDKKSILEQCIQAKEIFKNREYEIISRLSEIESESTNQNKSQIRCKQLLPIVRVRIGSSTLLIKDEYSRSTIFKNEDGEIIIGTN